MNHRNPAIGLLFILLVSASTAHGFDIWVNSAADSPLSASAEPGECRTGFTVFNPETGQQVPGCTLRAAIEAANALGQSSTQDDHPQGLFAIPIRFEPWIPLTAANTTTIQPETPLPIVQFPIHIDGTTHRNFDAAQGWASFLIDGQLLDDPENDHGLVFGPGSAGSIVDGITIVRFPGAAIVISSNWVVVRRSRLGVSFSGNFSGGNASFPNGLGILINGSGNLIGHHPVPPGTLVGGEELFPNVIAGNSIASIDIVGGQSNRVLNNHIGVNRAGTTAIASGSVGIRIAGGASETKIGSFDLSDPEQPLLGGNIIAGHSDTQILIQAAENEIVCNHLGFNRNGDATLSPGSHGVLIGIAASANQIGHPDCPNRIHGIQSGIQIGNAAQQAGDGQVISGNWISIGSGGEAPAEPTKNGIHVRSGQGHELRHNRIGHAMVGIQLDSAQSLVENNRIGTGDDSEHFPITEAGIRIDGQDHDIFNNVIGNAAVGISLRADASGNALRRNRIGISLTDQPLPNLAAGVRLDGNNNILGGPDAGSSNLIGFNQGPGVIVDGADQRIWRNFIGLGATGLNIGNDGFGIIVLDSATGTRIGDDPGRANHIGGNAGGIQLNAASQVIFNRIGEAPNGFVVPNQGPGIDIGPGFDASIIEHNRIAHNVEQGVRLDPAAGVLHRLLNNEIYNNLGKGIDLGPGGRDQDPGDADTGPNTLQNYPQFRLRLSGYNPDSNELEVAFRVNSSPANSLYPIGVQFFYSDPGETHPQGMIYIGTVLYEEANAQSYITTTLPAPSGWSLSEGDSFVATATTADGNTSEFSDPFGMPPELNLGGVIENLQGTITLTNPLFGDTTSITGSGTVNFTMTEKLYPNEAFNVQITQAGQPPNQSCQLQNGQGIIGSEDYLDIIITCQDPVDQIFSDRFEGTAGD